MPTTKVVGVGVIVILAVMVGIILLQENSSNSESLTLSGLISKINNGDVSQIVKHNDEFMVIYQNGETQTMKLRDSDENIIQLLLDHGATTDQLDAVEFRYYSTSDSLSFP